MRILLVTQIYRPEMGAQANRMYPIVREMIARGHEVGIATGMPNYPQGVVYDGFQGRRTMTETGQFGERIERTLGYVAPRNKSKAKQLRSYLSFVRAAMASGRRFGRADVVMTTSPPLFSAIPAMLLAKRMNARFVLDLRDLWPDEFVATGTAGAGSRFVQLLARLERMAYARADLIACTTPAMAEVVSQRAPAGKRVIVAPNGADTEIFRPLSRPEVAGLLPDGCFNIVYSGLIGMKHGSRQIIEAFALLPAELRARLHFVGDGAERESLEALVAERSITGVTFHGPRPLSEIPRYLNAADVCVACLVDDPYFHRILLVKVLEYMACGRPVVLSAAGTTARVLEEAGAGLVTPPGDSAAMARAIEALANDAAKRESLASAGPPAVAARYDRKMNAEALVREVVGA